MNAHFLVLVAVTCMLLQAHSEAHASTVVALRNSTCTPTVLTKLVEIAGSKQKELLNGSTIARAHGLQTKYENITISIAQQFLQTYIPMDYYHGNSSGFVESIVGWDVYN